MDQDLIDAITRALAPIAAKIGKDPAPKDRPNAPRPGNGGEPGSGYGQSSQGSERNQSQNQLELLSECKGADCVHFRAPAALHGKVLHDIAGRPPLHGARVPADGVCHAHKADASLHEHLKAAGRDGRQGAGLDLWFTEAGRAEV
jgi:hypothetical protein